MFCFHMDHVLNKKFLMYSSFPGCSSAFAISVLDKYSSNGTAQRTPQQSSLSASFNNGNSINHYMNSSGNGGHQQKPQDTLSCLRDEIRKREDAMDRDSKMRKMAQLQLSVTSDSKNRQPILAQIENWEQNLELMQCDLYR